MSKKNIVTSAVELNSRLVNGNFSKGSNKGNAPKASDVLNQISNTIKKKEGK